jgi:cytoskeletal protein RodZ
MTESYLTTDIIVIIVLVVVLVLIGACAFFIHFYWTKIGVAEIWNTAKWSSMRSSFYQTIRRFSRASSSSKHGSERPFSAASAYSEDTDGSALPAPLRNKKPNTTTNPNAHPTQAQPSTTLKSSTTHHNVRRNSNNQVQPVTTITYNHAVKTNYGTRVGQSPENDIETHRF